MRWLKQLLCRHNWVHNTKERSKTCSKCNKVEEVFMGWV